MICITVSPMSYGCTLITKLWDYSACEKFEQVEYSVICSTKSSDILSEIKKMSNNYESYKKDFFSYLRIDSLEIWDKGERFSFIEDYELYLERKDGSF